MNRFSDLEKICRLLGFTVECDPQMDDEGHNDGWVAKLVMDSDCYTTPHQALEDLERRAVAMLEEVVRANH